MSGFFRLEIIEKPFNPRTVRTNQDARFTIQTFGTEQGTQRVVQRCLFLMKKDVLAVPAFNKLSSHRERLRLWGGDQRLGGFFHTSSDFHGHEIFGEILGSAVVELKTIIRSRLQSTRKNRVREGFSMLDATLFSARTQ